MNIPKIMNENFSLTAWEKRKCELLNLFSEHIYGKTGSIMPCKSDCHFISSIQLKSKVTINEYMLFLTFEKNVYSLGFTLYLPENSKASLPCILLLNPFKRNAEVKHSPQRAEGFFPFEEITKAGYAAIEIDIDDICLDDKTKYKEGILEAITSESESEMGAIAAWSYGTMRVIDWISTKPQFNNKKIMLAGFSRGGKAALWCAAQDDRISLVISASSGCTGAAITRDKQGEKIKDITTKFPHWFTKKYASYAENEDKLPIDQHQLLALIAPRPIYIQSSALDIWADPQSEFNSCKLVSDFYKNFGVDGLKKTQFPQENETINEGNIGYHVRSGEHDCKKLDWKFFIAFMNKYLD